MADKADESPVVEETTEQTETEQTTNEEPQVELDKPTDVEGELLENPGIEEETEEQDDANSQDEAEETTESEEKAEETPPQQDEAEVQPQDSVEEEEPQLVEDPGEFKPQNDYSFDVTTTDGKTIKITSLEEAEKFAEQLDESPELINASQFARFNRLVARMDVGLERERADYETNKQAYEQQQAFEAERTQQLTNWTNELKYLEGKGLIPKIDPAKDQDWLGNESDEAVKARMEIFKWMDSENQTRRQAGIAPVTSAVDAYRMMQAEQAESQAQTERTKEADTRRAKGSMIGGKAPHIPSNVPKGMIAGEGGSLGDILHEATLAQY